MTALERAKTFVNSRAAKTALKIMPLALATMATVTVTAPKAHADVALTPTSAKFDACAATPCSGGFMIDNQTSGFSQLPPNGAFTGAVSNGNMSGHFASPATGQFGQPVNFFFSGSATGDLTSPTISQLTISWKMDYSTPTDVNIDHVNVFFYYNGAGVQGECDDVAYQGTCDIDVSGLQGLFGAPSAWQVQVESFIDTPSGSGGVGTTIWNIDYLAIDATAYPPNNPPGVPEPASMLLALSGLPLIGTLIRKKR